MSGDRTIWLARAAGCALWASLGAALAQQLSPPGEVDLAAVLQLAREASPRLALERQSVSIAEAERIGASAYLNPSIGYTHSRQGGGAATLFEGSRQQQFGIDLPVPVNGQREARMAAAERGVEAARARAAASGSALAAEAAGAFVELLAAQEQAALLEEAGGELDRLHTIIVGREASGMASRYDVARVEVELGGTRARLEDARARTADRAGALAALLGLPDWRPHAQGRLMPLEMSDAAPERARERATRSPAALAAAREEEAARAGVEVARRERVPVPTFSLGRAWTTDPFGAANFVGMSVEVPLLDARRGPQARAEAQAIQANLRRQVVEAETAANLGRLQRVIALRTEALQRFDRESAGRAPALKQMAEDAYRLGRSSILELLDATRSRYELRQSRAELAAALLDAQVRYLALAGELESRAGRSTR